ncbi:MAG TPA: hypothetical protein VM870_08740, partial [Pyrinomonadaceae bacterium]|nr:hypothetical protein [Pyrinomonadaceae bacterium]
MTKDNILYGIIGLLVGLIVGFLFTNSINQRGYATRAAQQTTAAPAGGGPSSSAASSLPGDHPAV